MEPTDVVLLRVVLFIALPTVVGILLSKWICDAVRRRGWSPLGIRALRLVITVVWVSVAVAGATVVLGSFSFLSALTVSAVAGIAATLALQTTLQNILAGSVLFQRRFLRLGDVILFGGVKGTVVGIGLIEVVLKTENGALAMISKSNLLAGPMVNFSAATRLADAY